LLYSSHGGSASACLISLQLLKKPEISTEK
jgi:hypothetical protein